MNPLIVLFFDIPGSNTSTNVDLSSLDLQMCTFFQINSLFTGLSWGMLNIVTWHRYRV